MTEMEKQVYLVLTHFQMIKTERIPQQRFVNSVQQENHCHQFRLSETVFRVEMGLTQLSADERFILRRHLVEGNRWDSVLREYQKLRHKGKSQTTLRRMQSNAIAKIAAHVL